MFGIMTSALNGSLRFLFYSATIKFVITSAFVLIFSHFAFYITNNLLKDNVQSLAQIKGFFDVMGPESWFFIHLFRMDFGLPVIFSTLGARFLLRRIPIIG